MAIKLIGKIKGENLEDLRNWCRSKAAIATFDYSSYVQGRLQLWLFHKCVDLRTGRCIPGFSEERIHAFSQKVYPGSDIGLLSFHGQFGNRHSSGLIKPHRDSSYARPIARLVNLGEAVFSADGKQYKLGDGDIIEFNCKQIHSVDSILTAERFSLVFWQMK